MSNPKDLSHHGIKGMKWGVRRKSPSAAPSVKARTKYDKAPKRLTDAELSARIRRMELEKKYNDLNSKDKSEGKKYAENLLRNTGNGVAATIVGGVVGFAVKRALKKKFPDLPLPDSK